jgi:hypothetical protein
MYENVDLIKMTLQKALNTFSIDCCNDTSISIAAKKILTTTKSKYIFFNDIESYSYLYYRDSEKLEKIETILAAPVRSYVAVGSNIMAVLGLSMASKTPILETAKVAIYAAILAASLPPVDFYNSKKLIDYISNHFSY